MTLRYKPDANQQRIVDALENVGCSVHVASRMGGGFPDLVVGRNGVTHLLEVKNPDEMRKDGTPRRPDNTTIAKQRRFKEAWRGGPVHIVTDPASALAAVGLFR